MRPEPALARRAAGLPAAERLDAGPGAGGRARAAVDVHARPPRSGRRNASTSASSALKMPAVRPYSTALASSSASSSESTGVTVRKGRKSSSRVRRWPRGRPVTRVGCDEAAVALAAEHDLAVAAGFGDRRVEALGRAGARHRAERGRRVGRVAERQLARAGGDPLDQLVVHGALDDHARARAALLARQPVGRADDARRGGLEVGARRDDRRVLAAHLDDQRPQRRASRAARCAIAWPASAEPVKATPSMSASTSARPVASSPWTRLRTPGGQPGLDGELGDQAGRPRRLLGRLHHHRVAGDQRAAAHARPRARTGS